MPELKGTCAVQQHSVRASNYGMVAACSRVRATSPLHHLGETEAKLGVPLREVPTEIFAFTITGATWVSRCRRGACDADPRGPALDVESTDFLAIAAEPVEVWRPCFAPRNTVEKATIIAKR